MLKNYDGEDYYNEIYKGIWVGSCPVYNGIVRYDLAPFNTVVLCADNIQCLKGSPNYDVFNKMTKDKLVVRCPFQDDVRPFTERELMDIRYAVLTTSNRWKVWAGLHEKDSGVLFTCQGGVNRSALVAALTIMNITELNPDEIVLLIRSQRKVNCKPLFNESFVKFLHKIYKKNQKDSARAVGSMI